MLRRDFTWALYALAATSAYAEPAKTAARPPFWLARQRRSRVYLFGFSEASDRSWFTPSIQRAFESSSQLWLELDQSQPPEEMNAVIEKYGRDPDRTFLGSLDPALRERAQAYMRELEIKPESVETMRPWLAYYTFAFAFSARKARTGPVESPDRVLADLAKAASKNIGYEKSMAQWIETLASMPDKAQAQYIQWLLDHFDDQKNGLTDGAGWITGNPSTRSLDRMRTLPELYRVMQPDRNVWWANRIVQLLKRQEVHFIAVGMLHVLGPDGIPRQLQRLGVDLIPNP